jgi:hypothetical protein
MQLSINPESHASNSAERPIHGWFEDGVSSPNQRRRKEGT